MAYLNAPIVEAVFDVKVSNTIIINPVAFEQFAKTDLKEFPISTKRQNINVRIDHRAGAGQVGKTTNLLGYMFSNIQGNRKVQFRLDGYTFNMLRPYSHWDEFSSLAFTYLKKYLSLAKPLAITRIGLRYINRIDLPFDNQQFENYIKYLPQVPAGLPKKYEKYFLQMQIPAEDGLSKAVISQTFEQEKAGRIPFIIDIDVFQTERQKPSDNLLEKFNSLRILKNRIFEDLVTDNCKKMFN
ncbi:MAG: TIGR04255 family protein [Chitinophagaceae bacterium]